VGVVGAQTVDEVAQFVDAPFADVLQVLSKAELDAILDAGILAGTHTASQHRTTSQLYTQQQQQQQNYGGNFSTFS